MGEWGGEGREEEGNRGVGDDVVLVQLPPLCRPPPYKPATIRSAGKSWVVDADDPARGAGKGRKHLRE